MPPCSTVTVPHIPHLVQLLLVLALDGLALAEDLRVRGNDAVLGGVRLDYLELDAAHASTSKESVALREEVMVQMVRDMDPGQHPFLY